MNLPRSIGAGALLLACLSLGCGGGNPLAPANISGSVTYKGKAVPAGTVQYVTSDGVAYSSPIAKDGTYSITDLPVGDMVVVVETKSAKEQAVKKDKDLERRMGSVQSRPGSNEPGSAASAAAAVEAPVYMMIPEKYEKKETSPLTFPVKAGRNVNPIELID